MQRVVSRLAGRQTLPISGPEPEQQKESKSGRPEAASAGFAGECSICCWQLPHDASAAVTWCPLPGGGRPSSMQRAVLKTGREANPSYKRARG